MAGKNSTPATPAPDPDVVATPAPSMDLLAAADELDKMLRQREALTVIRDAVRQVGSFEQAVREAQKRAADAGALADAAQARLATTEEQIAANLASAKADFDQTRRDASQLVQDAKAEAARVRAASAKAEKDATARLADLQAQDAALATGIADRQAELDALSAKLEAAKLAAAEASAKILAG